MYQSIPSNHSTIQEPYPRSLTNLKSLESKEQQLTLVPRPTKRYMKQCVIDFLYCPDCESPEIIYYGVSSSDTQKHKCKSCAYQFVAQYDAYFPRSKRRDIFEAAFMANLERQGFNAGTGKKLYWEGARLRTLSLLESNKIKIRVNKMIKQFTVRGEQEYRILLEFVLNEAYLIARR